MANERERLAVVESTISIMEKRQGEIYTDVKSILSHVAIAEEKEKQRLRDDRKTVAKSVIGGTGAGGIVAGIAELINRLT
jgi:hypothetical protein